MRISLTAEKEVVEAFSSASPDTDEDRIEDVHSEVNKDEFAFGLVEIATCIAIAKGLTELVNWVSKMHKELQQKDASKPAATLQLRTALGSTTIILNEATTFEALSNQLKALFP